MNTQLQINKLSMKCTHASKYQEDYKDLGQGKDINRTKQHLNQ